MNVFYLCDRTDNLILMKDEIFYSIWLHQIEHFIFTYGNKCTLTHVTIHYHSLFVYYFILLF